MLILAPQMLPFDIRDCSMELFILNVWALLVESLHTKFAWILLDTTKYTSFYLKIFFLEVVAPQVFIYES